VINIEDFDISKLDKYFESLNMKCSNQSIEIKDKYQNLCRIFERGNALLHMVFMTLSPIGPLVDDSHRGLHTLLILNTFREWRLCYSIYELILEGKCDEANILMRCSIETHLLMFVSTHDSDIVTKWLKNKNIPPKMLRQKFGRYFDEFIMENVNFSYRKLSNSIHGSKSIFGRYKTSWITTSLPKGDSRSFFCMELPYIDSLKDSKNLLEAIIISQHAICKTVLDAYREIFGFPPVKKLIGHGPQELNECWLNIKDEIDLVFKKDNKKHKKSE